MSEALCRLDDIPVDGSKSLQHGEDSLFAVHHDGQIFVYRNRCPHLGVELNWNEDEFLDADGQLLMCSTHGALFMPANGECIAGPCQGEYLEAVPVREEDGQLFLA